MSLALILKLLSGFWKRVVWPVVKFPIPIPLGIIAAVALVLWFDHSAYVAAKKQIRDIVAGSEIAALQASNAAKDKLIDQQKADAAENARKARALAAANDAYRKAAADAQAQASNLQDQINEILASGSESPPVGPDLAQRLHNR